MLSISNRREKTVTVSLRISETAFKALQEDSAKVNVSLNTLANQLFLAYANHDRFLNRFRMVKVSTPTLRKIINSATREEIAAAGKEAGRSIPSSFVLSKMGELTLANGIEFLRMMGEYGNMFDYSQTAQGGRTFLTLAHNLGENGSLFLASYVESMFEQLGKHVKIMQYPDSVTIEI